MNNPSVQDGANPKYPPSRTAGLAPRWQPGVSGNPSGLTKDGLPSKSNRVRQTLQQKLSDPKTLRRFVDTWIKSACEGDSAAREQILKRLDPVVDSMGGEGRVILQGIRLELDQEGRAKSVEIAQRLQGEAAQLSEASSCETFGASAVPEGHEDAVVESDAVRGVQESQWGTSPLQIAQESHPSKEDSFSGGIIRIEGSESLGSKESLDG